MIAAVDTVLPGPEREVLALLAESGLDYDAIAELLGVTRLDVAALAAAGRLRLAGVTPPEACRSQLPRLAGLIDGEPVAVARHPADCATCAQTLHAMRAADAHYRSAAPAPMPEALRAQFKSD